MPSPRYQKGHKKLGGRKSGTLNKKTQRRLALEKLSSDELQQIMLAELKLSPLEVMQAVMLLRINRGDYDGALVAAEKAAPYMHPRLNATDVNVRHSYASKSDAEVAAEIESLRQKIEIAQRQSAAAASPMIEATAEPLEPAPALK
jgi:hypothetical protein